MFFTHTKAGTDKKKAGTKGICEIPITVHFSMKESEELTDAISSHCSCSCNLRKYGAISVQTSDLMQAVDPVGA